MTRFARMFDANVKSIAVHQLGMTGNQEPGNVSVEKLHNWTSNQKILSKTYTKNVTMARTAGTVRVILRAPGALGQKQVP